MTLVKLTNLTEKTDIPGMPVWINPAWVISVSPCIRNGEWVGAIVVTGEGDDAYFRVQGTVQEVAALLADTLKEATHGTPE